MRGRLAQLAEVAGRAHDALAEMLLPDTVGHDPRGQRILWTGYPLRKLQAAAPLRDWRLVFACDDAREMPRHELTQPIVAAANVDAHVVHTCLRTKRTAAFLGTVCDRNRRQWNSSQG